MMRNDVHVAKLRLHKLRENSPAVRLRLANLLNMADLRPPDLPPSSVLIVRHLADPLPGQMALSAQALRTNTAWESAVQQRLNNLSHSAARSVNGLILNNPEAVLFADEAEMLACLALDISRGQAGQHWWWQAIRRTLPATDSLPALFCQKAPHVPAVLQSLSAWGQVEPVLRALSPPQALAVLAAVGHAYNLPDWGLTDIRPTQTAAGGQVPPATGVDISSISHSAASNSPQPTAVPPWQIPQATAIRFNREQLCLLGVSLTLRQRPRAVRQPAFGQALRQWWAARATAAQTTTQYKSSPTASEPISSPVAGVMPERTGSIVRTESGAIETETAVSPQKPQPHKLSGLNQPVQSSVKGINEPQTVAVPGTVDHQKVTRAGDDLQPAALTPRSAEMGWSDGVTTQIGGVLYLINLMQYLDLPACFEAEWQLASQMGPWGVLELLGRALLSEDGQAWDDDPMWDALAMLDSRRPGTLPGDAFKGRGSAHLPAQWIGDRKPPWPWSGGTRLKGTGLDRLNPQLQRWLAVVLPFVRWQLGQALGCDGTESALSPTMLVVPARLFITASHVDLVLRLEDISLPARLAGLDRNPGWLPDFGQVVLFHFE